MALVSPGLQLSVTDESQYVSGAVGSVPLIVLATEQDKTNPAGVTAAGTTQANAGKLQAYASQRELVSAFGYPMFQQSAAGTPLNGDERNEYGLMAAYSALGISNRVYAIRADIDLAQLVGTSNRPAGIVPNSTYWLDTSETAWGIYEWDAVTETFNNKVPLVITNSSQYVNNGGINYPLTSVGDIGAYAVVPGPTSTGTPYNDSVWWTFRKSNANVWNIVGSNAWESSIPTITGSVSSPTIPLHAVTAASIVINGTEVTIGSTTQSSDLAHVVTAINAAAITGVTSAAVNGKLVLYSNETANGGTSGITIANGVATPLTSLGIAAGDYNSPSMAFASYVGVPAWRATDVNPQPSGSVWVKTTAIGGGANIVVKKMIRGTWTTLTNPLMHDDEYATYTIDPSGGGYNISGQGAIYTGFNQLNDTTLNFKLFHRRVAGAVKTVANVVGTTPFTIGHAFTIAYSTIGSSELTTPITVTLSSTSRSGFVTAILAAGANVSGFPDYITAAVESSGAISLTHKTGGQIHLTNVSSGTAIANAGFIDEGLANGVTGVSYHNGTYHLTGWEPLTYTYSSTEPTQNPDDGTLWYYGSATDVDIMVNTLTGWSGYQNEGNDARGYDLSNTDPSGVIVSASKPTSQTDSTSLVAGDLWLNTSDLENWPALSRYNGSSWVKIDNTDQISQNGIVFADARWDTDGTTDPVSGTMPSIVGLLSSDYIDQDAPDYRLYPRGTLLFNTRRSGYNVKRFVNDYFNDTNFSVLPNVPGASGSLPSVSGAWISASGLKDNGSMYAGHQAQRNMVVKALKGAIDGSTSIREDQYAFNLIAAPGYPELISNMVSLNNDRANTAFIIGDTPMRLAPSTVDIINWSNNTDNETGLTTNDPYLGVYYPGAASTNDIAGNAIIVPPSHVALRTFLHNDNLAYQWFAPAGTRRGLVDNAVSVGYIDSTSGEYNPIGVNQGLRDSLYENKINPITNLPGVGLVVWGQKTRNPTASAMDRINVARLVNYIRTILANVGNGFLFEPNDKITRDQLKTIISGAINDLVSKRGIYDYLVVCDDSNNTPDRIARNELYVDVAIEPTKDVEFIYIPIRLYNPGAVANLGK